MAESKLAVVAGTVAPPLFVPAATFSTFVPFSSVAVLEADPRFLPAPRDRAPIIP